MDGWHFKTLGPRTGWVLGSVTSEGMQMRDSVCFWPGSGSFMDFPIHDPGLGVSACIGVCT